ncbi:hypothetical protein [Winogradskyella immobilis]|uniref:Uncharacterized protein n=1 Tax=Winogradskyella immobilis TaxID=2816852 RepID=A0ABS8EL43_9FLAO|nr:hypothetical protein [Winogradskyella immobilis]MCC1483027.1 hypothetical protein [Winogradskyella immobilis]MCG0015122.1 hypothetical protein [Winogradskyella immobilis]
MKTIKKITLITGLILGGFNFIYAQGVTSIDVATEKLRMSADASKRIDAQGSPYVNEAFLPIKIKGQNNIFTGRYNAYNGEMEINLGTKIIALDVKNDYEVIFTQTNKIYKTYYYLTKDGVSKKGFLAVVSENDSFSLLKRENIKYYDTVKATSTYQKDKPAKFKRESDTYFIKKGDNISFMPTKKKELLNAFPKHAKAIKTYLKDNKLSTNKEEDLIKVAQYITSL